MDSATIPQTPISVSGKTWLKEFKEHNKLDTYGDAIAKIVEVYKRTLLTPAQIVSANDPEVYEAEHVIERALEVIHDKIPAGEHE